MATSGNLREALTIYERVATNRLSALTEWRTATLLALAAGDDEAYHRLCRVGVLRFASVADEHDAFWLANAFLHHASDETILTVARAMINKAAAAHDWSKDYTDLHQAYLAHLEHEPAKALEHLDRFLTDTRLRSIAVFGRNRPGNRAAASFFRATLCAELGRTEEARNNFAQGQEDLKRASAVRTILDPGEHWTELYLGEIRRREAEVAFKAKGITITEVTEK
jgi:hypothetical protein